MKRAQEEKDFRHTEQVTRLTTKLAEVRDKQRTDVMANLRASIRYVKSKSI